MRIIEQREVEQRLEMQICIGLMREALMALESGQAAQPVRFINHLPGGSFGFMPAYLSYKQCFGAKVLTAFPANMGTEYPSHMGYVMLFEAEHGSIVGMADATAITEIRTAAVSGAATDLLARADAGELAIIGAGAQGRSHLEAMLAVRHIRQVRVFDIDPAAAKRYQTEMQEKFDIPITVCGSAEEAIRNADIVCTLTPSKAPFVQKDWVKPGAHINAVGTFSPTTGEVTPELFAAARVYADQLEAMERESGEYLTPLQQGLITKNHVVGSVGQALLGQVPGRQSEEEITLFDALGLAVEDVVCAHYLLCE